MTLAQVRVRYAFAMSSFARMFGPYGIDLEMRSLCKSWSEDIDRSFAPISDLYQVDRYFLELWKKRYDDPY
jgi:hypothetical protein